MSAASDLRHSQIIEFLKEYDQAKVVELSNQFKVTEETIRRDLDRLEEEGLVIRKHGAAVLRENYSHESSFDERSIKNIEEKRSIAKEAIKYIKTGDRIYLDGSTTAWQMSRFIQDMEITVITNSLKVVSNLIHHEKMKVICLGGEVIRTLQTVSGLVPMNLLREYHLDKCFISCQGLDAEWGVSDNNEDVVALKKIALKQSKVYYLLVDRFKIHQKSSFLIAPTEKIEYLITNQMENKDLAAKYKSKISNFIEV